jgi:hypothetical protein
MTKPDPKRKLKLKPFGIGRPRKSNDDSYFEDMPKLNLRPSPKHAITTADIVKSVTLASRYKHNYQNSSDACYEYLVANFPKVERTADNTSRVKRWLKKPAKFRPPTPKSAINANSFRANPKEN